VLLYVHSRARPNASNPSVCEITSVVASSESLSIILQDGQNGDSNLEHWESPTVHYTTVHGDRRSSTEKWINCALVYIVTRPWLWPSLESARESPTPPGVFCKTRLIRKFINPNIPESQLVRIGEALLHLILITNEYRTEVWRHICDWYYSKFP
jgi:hypothetical protein